MSARFEAFLARIYVDADVCRRFLADPERAALDAGLEASEARALVAIDRVGLELAGASFERKRAAASARSPASLVSRLGRLLSRGRRRLT